MGFDWLAPKNYKRHFICLGCQKGFKRPSEKDMKHAPSSDLSNLMDDYYASDSGQDIVKFIETAYQKLEVVCPHCGNQMLQVHYNFEVPPQRDQASWKKLRHSMQPKTEIKYDGYIQWHRLAIQREEARSARIKVLTQNLAQLEKMTQNR